MPDGPTDGRTVAASPANGGHRFGRALLAIDPSKGAPRPSGGDLSALRAIAKEVVLCHVVLRSTGVAANESDGSPADDLEQEISKGLRALAVDAWGPDGADAPIRILHGDPGERICEYAEFAGCDLIVVGPRARASFARRFKGSLTRYVVGNTRRSVWVLGD
jgi:nucleotide-binding universal stress UspA family protein